MAVPLQCGVLALLYGLLEPGLGYVGVLQSMAVSEPVQACVMFCASGASLWVTAVCHDARA